MADAAVATTHQSPEAAHAAKTPVAPEAPAPDLAPDAAVQAVVESFRQAGTSGVAGGAATGGAGGGAPPGAPRWTPRPAVGARDLVALQRMAGNRAVSSLVARRAAPAAPAAAVQRQPSSVAVQRDGTSAQAPAAVQAGTGGEGADTAGANGEDSYEAQLKKAKAMVVRSASSAQAAKDLSKWAAHLTDKKTGLPLKLVIITLEQTSMTVYDRDGNHLKGPFALALPKGTYFDEGVFVTMPGGGSSMRIRLDPKTQRFRPYENAAILEEVKPAGKGAKTEGGAEKSAATTPSTDPPPGSAVLPAPKTPKAFDLRKYMKDPGGLDALAGQFGDAAEFLVVRTPPESAGGTGKGKGGPRSTGFGGELEGHGTPPNRPPWPVTMEGPKTLPVGGQGTFAATINWAAEGSNTISMITAQMGNDIHYRWELFDITEQAKREADKEAARAQQAKDAIAALMGTAAGDGTTGKPGAGDGTTGKPGTGGKPAAKGAAVVAPPKPKAVGSPEDKSLADEIMERQTSRAGTGADQNGITAGADFERDFSNLWADTKRTWAAAGTSKKETKLERMSDDVANYTAVALLPISGIITALGASFRYGSEKFGNERQQQDIPLKKAGTYLVRVIATPRVQTTPDGQQIIRPSSVAVQTVKVTDMEKMVADALRDPGTALKELQNAKEAAEKAGDKDAIAAADAKLKAAELDIQGDPLAMLDAKIAAKEKELTATEAKWKKYNIRGPIIEVENQLETLKKRRELYKLQEDRRVSQLNKEGRPITPAIRVNATLLSELTGSPYPLLISVGNMGMAGTKHRWKVLDATSKKAEGFEGLGDTASEAVEMAFQEFAKDAQYGRGVIGVQLPQKLLDQLEPGAKADRRYTSAPAGWAVARGRIDDLVMTLAAIGLFIASAGTAAAILGGVVAAAKLIHRLHAGTLELDVEMVSDLLAVFGAVAATAQGFAKGAEATAKAAQTEAKTAKAVHIAGLRAQPVGGMFVLAPETAAVESNLAKASAALAKAGSLAKRVEWANEALGYAGLVWGNGTFLMTMADIAAQEASGAISASEARRQRANAIGGAIQNNGMFVAGNAMKAKAAAKAAKAQQAAAAAKTQPSATTGGTAEHPTAKPATGEPGAAPGTGADPAATTPAADQGTAGASTTPKENLPEVTTPKEQTGPQEPKPGEKPAAQDKHTTGGPDEATGNKKPPEPNVPESQPGAKPGEGPAAAAPSDPVAAGGKQGAKPEPPKPGSKKARAAAKEALEGVANGEKRGTTVEEAIKLAGDWKDALKKAVGKLGKEDRVKAEEALVETRDKLVKDTWAEVQKKAGGKYDALRLENAGTKSFGSDIDGTIRPLEGTEAQGTGKQMSEQVKLAAEAAQELSKALRDRVGGETDVVIDTNIYSFIGEGRVKATDAKAKGAQQQVDIVVGLAEQLRGQNEAQFKAFEQRLAAKAGDPRVAAEAKGLLAKAREFHDARVSEWKTALADAKAKSPKDSSAAQNRAAREALLGQKKQELSGLMGAEPPNLEAIAAKQAEINWFAPDAYATPSAFKQAVAHGQRLKGAPRTAREMKGSEVAAKLREAAGKLGKDNPKAAKLKADAELVENQQKLLDATVRELEALQKQTPMDTERIDTLERRAERMREAIAAPAEKIIIAELLGETMPGETVPGDRPGPKQLSESAAASGANMGMLEDHVRHAKDLDGKVKAAAKYAARIAMAEWLSGLKPASDAVAKLLGEFVQSRWDVNAEFAPEHLRDMFLKYALMTGKGKGIVHDKQGLAVGVTDQVKQAFVDDVTAWARSTNDGIQVAAIGAKTFDSPIATASVTGGGAALGASVSGSGGTGSGGAAGGGGSGKAPPPPPAGGDAAPAPSGGPEKPAGGSGGEAAPVPQDRPTIPAPAPADDASGPATRREGAAAQEPAAVTGTGGEKAPGGGEKIATKVEDIPGGIVVKKDDFAVVVSAKNDAKTFVRIAPQGNTLRLTDIFNQSSMPAGVGTVLLAEALKQTEAARGNELVIVSIQNEETIAAYEAKQGPAESKLGRVAARGLGQAGYAAGTMRWDRVEGKLAISIEIR